VKQALIDVYSAECSRLQGEVKRLSAADVTTGSEDSQHQYHHHHHHQQQQQQKQQQKQQQQLPSSVSAAATDVQKISQVFVISSQSI